MTRKRMRHQHQHQHFSTSLVGKSIILKIIENEKPSSILFLFSISLTFFLVFYYYYFSFLDLIEFRAKWIFGSLLSLLVPSWNKLQTLEGIFHLFLFIYIYIYTLFNFIKNRLGSFI